MLRDVARVRRTQRHAAPIQRRRLPGPLSDELARLVAEISERSAMTN